MCTCEGGHNRRSLAVSKDVLYLDYKFMGKHRPVTDGASANGPFVKTITGAAPPTVQSNNGRMELALTATNEVQNACLSWGDELGLSIDKIISVDFWAALTASLPAAVTASFGLASARNDAPTSITNRLLWQCAGDNNVKVLASDGTNTLAATAVGHTLSTTLRRFTMDFGSGVLTQAPPALSKGGKASIKLAMENSQGLSRAVLPNTLVNLSAYSGGLQPFVQLQKTAGTAVATLSIERILIGYRQG
jgi:hypothetical protein